MRSSVARPRLRPRPVADRNCSCLVSSWVPSNNSSETHAGCARSSGVGRYTVDLRRASVRVPSSCPWAPAKAKGTWCRDALLPCRRELKSQSASGVRRSDDMGPLHTICGVKTKAPSLQPGAAYVVIRCWKAKHGLAWLPRSAETEWPEGGEFSCEGRTAGHIWV